MQERQKKILKSIIREYQRTGLPVASQALIDRYRFGFSPATVRSEMLLLDEQGFLEQPHTSAGRIPTDKAYRLFLEETESNEPSKNEQEQVWEMMDKFHQESVREMAQFLADCTRNLGISGFFGDLADFHGAGLKWLAEEPEFERDDLKNIMRYFDSLEEDFNHFFKNIDEEVEVFIGQENPIKYLRNYSLVVTGFEKNDNRGVLGILGPKRMNYHKNKFVLKEAKKKLKK